MIHRPFAFYVAAGQAQTQKRCLVVMNVGWHPVLLKAMQEDLHTAVFEQECLIQMLIFVFDNHAVPITDCML